MNLSLVVGLCCTVGWFWCVIFGSYGQLITATIGAVFLILIQLYYIKIKDISLYIQDVLLVIFSIPLGVILEVFFIQANLIHYMDGNEIFPPLWVVMLYPFFSLLLNHPLNVLKKNYPAGFVVGFLGAPLSYIAGGVLGGLTIEVPLIWSWGVIGVGWGFYICLLIKIGNVVEKAALETLVERDSKNKIRFLYDGECPICDKEICFLRKKNVGEKVNFIDIASKEYRPSENGDIDYRTAMSQIHAIDGKGNLLVGIPAFAAVYASCELLITSTLFRIPFMKVVLKPLYTVFAKNRVWLTGRRESGVEK